MYMTVTWLSHDCHMTLTWLSHDQHVISTWLIVSCYGLCVWLLVMVSPRHPLGDQPEAGRGRADTEGLRIQRCQQTSHQPAQCTGWYQSWGWGNLRWDGRVDSNYQLFNSCPCSNRCVRIVRRTCSVSNASLVESAQPLPLKWAR